jgi:predicted amidohydrolase YtcJ
MMREAHGGGTVGGVLLALAAARAANGFSGILHDVGHNSSVRVSDIGRARAIGATFEMSPYMW